MRAGRAIAAVAITALLPACGDDPAEEAAPSSTSVGATAAGEAVAATELVVGDCLSGIAVGVAERTEIGSAMVVSCQLPHELEVFASFELDPAEFETQPLGAYPGEQPVVRAADAGCATRLRALVDDTLFGLIAVWPTQPSWAAGDRQVSCAAFPAGGGRFEGPGLLAET
jgi:hypothetical protein